MLIDSGCIFSVKKLAYFLCYLYCIIKFIMLQALDPLIQTLQCLTNSILKKPTIYLTQEMRDSDIQKSLWNTFYEKLIEIFHVEKIPEEQQHANYRSSDITLLRINKK